MKIGLVQYNPHWEQKNENQKVLQDILTKSNEQYSAIIFPEMTLTGFTMRSKEFSESLNGNSIEFFNKIAREYNTNVFCGLIEQSGNDYFNSLIHIDRNGELIKIYRKVHPFSYSGEDKNYKRGEETAVTEIEGWKIGLSICYDLRFPELYRHYAKARVDLIINIANWPLTRIAHWRALLKARAIENQCFVAGVNRVGTDPSNAYNGFTSLFDPMGEELLAIEQEEGIFSCEVDLNKTSEIRAKLPFLRDMLLI